MGNKSGKKAAAVVVDPMDPKTLDQIHEILNDINNTEDVRDLWDALCEYCTNNRHLGCNLLVGLAKAGDTVLWNQMVNEEPGRGGAKAGVTVEFPPKDNVEFNPNGLRISGIAVIDTVNDGNGGKATVVSGGVGCAGTTINVTSKVKRGISHQVIIIGRHVAAGGVGNQFVPFLPRPAQRYAPDMRYM